jgi:uncharacterized protein YndB with AHSA1/START domain
LCHVRPAYFKGKNRFPDPEHVARCIQKAARDSYRLSKVVGLRLWLGDLDNLDLKIKGTYRTKEGKTGEIRVAKPSEQLRLTWRRAEWDKPSTLQIRLLKAGEGRTTVAFHQEQLSGPQERENAQRRLNAAMSVLSAKFQTEGAGHE